MRHETIRQKHKRIRCPECGNHSTLISNLSTGLEVRKCKKCGKHFVYDYHYEYLRQFRYNWNMKLGQVS